MINEGTAVYFDQSNQDKDMILKSHLKSEGRNINVKDIWTNWLHYDALLKYPLAGLFVEKIIETYGKDNFMVFFENQTYENAKKILFL